jgi:hypothetical protein
MDSTKWELLLLSPLDRIIVGGQWKTIILLVAIIPLTGALAEHGEHVQFDKPNEDWECFSVDFLQKVLSTLISIDAGHRLEQPLGCSVGDRAKIFLTCKFSFSVFSNAAHKIETKTKNVED